MSKGDDQVRLNTKTKCRVSKNGVFFEARAAVKGEWKVGGRVTCPYPKKSKLGLILGPNTQVKSGPNHSQNPVWVPQKSLGQDFKSPVSL